MSEEPRDPQGRPMVRLGGGPWLPVVGIRIVLTVQLLDGSTYPHVIHSMDYDGGWTETRLGADRN